MKLSDFKKWRLARWIAIFYAILAFVLAFTGIWDTVMFLVAIALMWLYADFQQSVTEWWKEMYHRADKGWSECNRDWFKLSREMTERHTVLIKELNEASENLQEENKKLKDELELLKSIFHIKTTEENFNYEDE